MGANGKVKSNGYPTKMIEEETPTTDPAVEPEKTSSIISRLAAYKTISEAAVSIGSGIEEICKQTSKENHLLIVDDLDVATSDLSLLQVEASLKHFFESFNSILERIGKRKASKTNISTDSIFEPILAVIPELINAISALFKKNFSVSNDDFSIKVEALKIAVASNLTLKKKVIKSVRFLHFNMISDSDVIKRLTDLILLKAKIDRECEKLKRILSKTGEENSDIIKEWEILSTSFIKFFEAITTIVEKRSILLDAALREYIKKTKVTHLLYLSIPTSGGHTLAAKKFIEKGQFDFFGGSAVSYVLADTEGAILASDIITKLSKVNYEKVDDRIEYQSFEFKRRGSEENGMLSGSNGKAKPPVPTSKAKRKSPA